MKATPRPFYRWKSFWLGLFVLVFLGWAWSDSFRNESAVWAGGAGRALVFVRGYGVTYVRAGTSTPVWEVGGRRGEPILAEHEFRDEALGFFGAQVGVRDALVFFPFAALWLAWLFFHWKREQKKPAFSRKL